MWPFPKKQDLNKRKSILKHYTILKKAESVADLVLETLKLIDPTTINFIEESKKLRDRIRNGATPDEILVDAFALAYAAVFEVYGIKLFKVQIMGGYTLFKGDVAEMKTGEGKTLTSILPAYLNALTGNVTYILTVNEYLAQRDAFNCGKVFAKLGLSTGCILANLKPEEKKDQYRRNIIYSTNSEFGFDYLRDNMVESMDERIQPEYSFAIIDEIDSILIDEARTPLVIAGGSSITDDQYRKANEFVLSLIEEDFSLDKEQNTVFLTRDGIMKAEGFYQINNLYSFENSLIVHRIQNALQAHHKFKTDVEYTVKNDEIVLIDIFTGRLLEGRTFSDGLHQALEAKENVKIKPENKTVASITYQNLFRMFKKLSGMTGTAQTEEEEFTSVYNMRVIPIPTNRGINRVDHADVIFATRKAKFEYVIKRIREIHETSQPILVGTRSVVDSAYVSEKLKLINLKHEVLNAKNHATEAQIIAHAGEKNAITISTNMAGRGTDIKLGDGVLELGGLFVLGTERHESRRIDAQLRGRSGRQGDIGHSQFIVSMEDEVLLRSGFKRLARFQKSLDTNPLESKSIGKMITSAQKKMEGMNHDSRKSILEYDDVSNRQRILTYKQRDIILTSKALLGIIEQLLRKFCSNLALEPQSFQNMHFNSTSYINYINEIFEFEGSNKIKPKTNVGQVEMVEYAFKHLLNVLKEKVADKDQIEISKIIRKKMVMTLDYAWQNQLERLQKIKSSIHFRQYSQKNPVQAYIQETDKLFDLYKKEIIKQMIMLVFRTSY